MTRAGGLPETRRAAPVQPDAAQIRGMVEGLQTRLDANGGTAAEWAQLITALGVRGDGDAARAARDKATAASQGDAAALEQIAAAAARAGLDR